MIYTIYRITAPILDRIPDVSQFSQKRQVSIGLLASLAFHLLLLLFALAVSLILPERLLVKFATPKPELQEIEVTVLPPDPVPEEVMLMTMDQIQNPKSFIDSLGLNRSDKAPENPVFESDVDMVAASQLPASGSVPLPSQDGRDDTQFPAFSTQQFLLGKTALPFPVDANQPQPSASNPGPATPPAPKSFPVKPQPIPQQPVQPEPPQPQEAPLPKTAEMPKVETNAPDEPASEDDLILRKKPDAQAGPDRPRPVPVPSSTPLPRPMMRTTAPIALLTTPVPEPPAPPPAEPAATASPQRPVPDGFQPEQEKTRIEGSIDNRGTNSVDAIGTPLGRYQKAAKTAIASRWYFYVKDKLDHYPAGTVKVSFEIDGGGKVRKLKINYNTSNSTYRNVCERSVLEAEIPPIPPDVRNVLFGERLDMDLTFTLYERY